MQAGGGGWAEEDGRCGGWQLHDIWHLDGARGVWGVRLDYVRCVGSPVLSASSAGPAYETPAGPP